MIFEGPMIILAITAMTVFHPGRIFGQLWVPAGKGVESVSKFTEGSVSLEPLTETEWSQTAYKPVDQQRSHV